MIVGTEDGLVTVNDSKRAFEEMTMSEGKTFNLFDIGHLSMTFGS